MSLFNTVEVTCGACGGTHDVSRSASINADRRGDLRRAILDGSFQVETCSDCGARIRLPVQLNYLDIGRGQWIIAKETDDLGSWREVEANAQVLFDTTFGCAAPPLERELGAGLAPRLVFGWPALREKLLCGELGLNDVAVELFKLAIMRAVQGSPVADDTELRLVDGDLEELQFAWLRYPGEVGLTGVTTRRDLYDAVEVDRQGWRELGAELARGPFVDVRRLFFA